MSNAPDSGGADAAYGGYLAAGEFRIQQCDDCDRFYFVPRVLCPYCGSQRFAWRETSGKATVYSTSTVRQSAERGGPYNVSIVALEEGPHMISRIVGVEPHLVGIGMAVRPIIEKQGDSHSVVFVPDGAVARSPCPTPMAARWPARSRSCSARRPRSEAAAPARPASHDDCGVVDPAGVARYETV